MNTTNLRCSTLLAKLADADLTVDDWGEVVDLAGSKIRVLHITDDKGRYIEAIITEHDNGCYNLFVEQQSPVIDMDVEFIKATMRDYGGLPLALQP